MHPLRNSFKENDCFKYTFLIGVLADKDYRRILQLITPYARRFICVTPDSPRALHADALAAEISGMGFPAVSCGSIEDGLRLALDSEGPVMAFGSLYLAGHVRTVFPRLLKKKQRSTVLKKRDTLSVETRAAASDTVCKKLPALEAYRNAKTIFLFRAFRSELDLSLFAEQAERDGKVLAYPYCPDRSHMLALKPGESWKADRFGIPVPVPEQSTVIDPADIDLVLCPCVAFDRDGRRLGMGAGYYDRFLPQCRNAVKILIAFEAQCLDRVCTEAFDLPVDAVITEERTDYFA